MSHLFWLSEAQLRRIQPFRLPYRQRNAIERMFNRLRDLGRIATRMANHSE